MKTVYLFPEEKQDSFFKALMFQSGEWKEQGETKVRESR